MEKSLAEIKAEFKQLSVSSREDKNVIDSFIEQYASDERKQIKELVEKAEKSLRLLILR